MRALAAALALAVALASLLHFAHSHEDAGGSVAKLCQLCATFDRGTAPPPAPAMPRPLLHPQALPSGAPLPASPPAPETTYEARAPPHAQA
jgi:hypothetical protein